MQSSVWNIMKLFNLLIYYSNNKIDQLYLRLNKKVKSVMSYTPETVIFVKYYTYFNMGIKFVMHPGG